MDYAEYWVMELARTAYPYFFGLVGTQEFLSFAWNRPPHSLSQTEMLDLLDRLASEGDIVARSKEQTDFTPTREQIDVWLAAREIEERRNYRLTPQGGERWERMAQVNWDRYHAFKWEGNDDSVREIIATTPEVAERAFLCEAKRYNLRAIPGTIERRIHHPWNATYWKSLPVGYGVRFHCEQLAGSENLDSYWIPWLFDRDRREATFDALIYETQEHSRREYEYFANWYTQHPNTPESKLSRKEFDWRSWLPPGFRDVAKDNPIV